MEGLDKRAPFTATGGMIPPEFQNIKTPCYILDEKALIKNAKLLGEVSERTGCKMLLAQKAFSNYDCYRFFEPYLAGTEVVGVNHDGIRIICHSEESLQRVVSPSYGGVAGIQRAGRF